MGILPMSVVLHAARCVLTSRERGASATVPYRDASMHEERLRWRAESGGVQPDAAGTRHMGRMPMLRKKPRRMARRGSDVGRGGRKPYLTCSCSREARAAFA